MAANIDALLKKIQQGPTSLLPDELDDLVSSFAPSQAESQRSKAYLILSSYCQSIRSALGAGGKQPDPATDHLASRLEGSIVDRIDSCDECSIVVATSFFGALFQVDWESASVIFQKDGMLSRIMETTDILPTPSVNLAVAHLLSLACSHKQCRLIITSGVTEWLRAESRQIADARVRAAAAIALIKLSKGYAVDSAEVTQGSSDGMSENDLTNLMKELVIRGEKSSVQDAVEGLAYLSVDPRIKEQLSKDEAFLKAVFSLVQRRKTAPPDALNNSLLYGILLLVANICTYRPQLTEELQHVEKLKKMANANKNHSEETVKLDDNHHVKLRVRRMVDAEVLAVFGVTSSYMDSSGIRLCASKALLSIIEDRNHRGKVLQSGGAKILGLIIKHSFMATNDSEQTGGKDNAPLDAIQALAKLAITSSPMQVFGPNEGAMYDVIRPFSLMVQHESASLLQRFEVMMALTNLATQSPELASRIAKADGLVSRVELLLLEDHVLVRRAAMELICNLIAGSDDIFEKYGGGENEVMTRSKLRVLFALSDVDDVPTRAAASGALATLTISANACRGIVMLQKEAHRALHILTLLIDPSSVPEDKRDEEEFKTEPGLVHRGIVCVRNLFANTTEEATLKLMVREAQEAGLVLALSRVVKGGKVEDNMLRPAVEALERIAEYK
ncbi:hypothetical protein APHAL10511_005894 [Amanita phalloides]|nr:hypothetical protein APHAL10511_005894 [Amanita phalloides]